jgi:hypothetical protein
MGVHHQERLLEGKVGQDKREDYIKLCRLRGLITLDVEEENDLKETKLMAAAAEGRYVSHLH